MRVLFDQEAVPCIVLLQQQHSETNESSPFSAGQSHAVNFSVFGQTGPIVASVMQRSNKAKNHKAL